MTPVVPPAIYVREVYSEAYAATRRHFVQDDLFRGSLWATGELWDRYCKTLKSSTECPDLELAFMFYVQACALWSMYQKALCELIYWSVDGDIPF